MSINTNMAPKRASMLLADLSREDVQEMRDELRLAMGLIRNAEAGEAAQKMLNFFGRGMRKFALAFGEDLQNMQWEEMQNILEKVEMEKEAEEKEAGRTKAQEEQVKAMVQLQEQMIRLQNQLSSQRKEERGYRKAIKCHSCEGYGHMES